MNRLLQPLRHLLNFEPRPFLKVGSFWLKILNFLQQVQAQPWFLAERAERRRRWRAESGWRWFWCRKSRPETEGWQSQGRPEKNIEKGFKGIQGAWAKGEATLLGQGGSSSVPSLPGFILAADQRLPPSRGRPSLGRHQHLLAGVNLVNDDVAPSLEFFWNLFAFKSCRWENKDWSWNVTNITSQMVQVY